MGYTGKKPTNVVDVSETQSLTVDGDLTVDTDTLKADSANNRVGVGVASPDTFLHVQDVAASTATHSYTKVHIEDSDHLALQFSGGTGGETWIWFADDTTATPVGGITYYHGGPYMAFRVEGSERLRIADNGMLTALGVYNLTTSGAANVNVQSSGAILRSTSSEKYKKNIEDMELSYAQAILNLRPVYYKSKCDLDNDDHSHWGFIAEEVAKVDPRLVHYKTMDVTFKEVVDEDGKPTSEKIETILETPEPEGVQYDRLTPAIVKLLQEQQKTIEALEARIKTLEAG